MKRKFIMMPVLIQGAPKKLGKDIDVYLKPLVEELLVVAAKRCTYVG
jgi:hypothetical protein